ncbi:MAG: tetratricopeptide repeat protein, partial [Actinomycetota bacterium]
PAAPAATAPAIADADALLRATAGGSLDATIASLQDRLRRVPGDWRAAATLGLAYVQQGRVSADPSYYPKAEEILARSLHAGPHENAPAFVGLAALASARHAFADALVYGRRAVRANPADGTVYGVVGDALLELGRYPAAFAAFQRMVDLKPGLSSYARVSYARELTGDLDGAVAAMRAARDVAGSPEDIAFASYQLGQLAWNIGDVDEAARRYREAAAFDPDWVEPLAGLARVAWARGDLDGAIEGYRTVVERSPLPEHVVMLGDLLGSAGDGEGASLQFDLARAEVDLMSASGVSVGLELALFEADHGDPAAAVDAARQEWRRRQSVQVADAYAWALHAAGRDRAAARLSRRALALGTIDARSLYHAGMIRLALGNEERAATFLGRALGANPWFSVVGAGRARRTLASLGDAA